MCVGNLVTLLSCLMEHRRAPCNAHLLSYLLRSPFSHVTSVGFQPPLFPAQNEEVSVLADLENHMCRLKSHSPD